eukprot:scaffold190908_cov67-Attheya_sp.AAC.1
MYGTGRQELTTWFLTRPCSFSRFDSSVLMSTMVSKQQGLALLKGADAQLAKLCIDGHSCPCRHYRTKTLSDILVYSAACHILVPFPIIYKLDCDTGSCDVITMDWLLNPTTTTNNNHNNNKSGDDACTV